MTVSIRNAPITRARIEAWYWFEQRAGDLYDRLHVHNDTEPGPVLSWFLRISYRHRKTAEREFYRKTGHGIYG